MDTDEEIKNRMEKIQKSLKETALGINYIQPEYKKKFVELAKKEYGDNYGIALQELIKIYEGFYPKGNEEVLAKIDILADEINKINIRIDAFESKKSSDVPEGYIKSADGSRLIKKR